MISSRAWIFPILVCWLSSTGCLGSSPGTETISSPTPDSPDQATLISEIPIPLSTTTVIPSPTSIIQPIVEQPIQEIPLGGPLNSADAQVSGLAWYGDTLVILPQYPAWFPIQNSSASLFTLSKAEIIAYLDGSSSGPLIPGQVPFWDGGISSLVDNFEGFEAIAFSNELIFLTIEDRSNESWLGYLISGTTMPDLAEINLNPDTLTPIPAPVDIINKSNEALVVAGENIVSLFEANGQTVNPNPTAHIFERETLIRQQIPMQIVEYRITDATPTDGYGQFWALNIFWPSEFWLFPHDDPIADRYGEGITHAETSSVERLIKLEYSSDGITVVDQPPVLLELADLADTRNWEGLALLDDLGFLIATDEFPETILAFIPYP